MTWWANTGQGTGSVRIRNATGGVVKTFEPDFGSGFEYSFSTFNPNSIAENVLDGRLNLYPNPAHGQFILDGNDLENSEIRIYDLLGKQVAMPFIKKQDKLEFNTAGIPQGIYLVTISKGKGTVTKKVMVN